MQSKSIELVLDIKTIKKNLDQDFTAYQKEYLTQYDEGESRFENKMALYPQTGQIISIGAKNIVNGRGFVIFDAQNQFKENFQDDNRNLTLYGSQNEKEILTVFWNLIASMQKGGFDLNRLITFNGKSFDVPFILYRSAVQQVKITHSLGVKSPGHFHIDLLEEVSFMRKIRKFNLDIIAHSLGVASHRSEDYNNEAVNIWYEEQSFDEIAFYSYDDVELIEKVFHVLKKSWSILY